MIAPAPFDNCNEIIVTQKPEVPKPEQVPDILRQLALDIEELLAKGGKTIEMKRIGAYTIKRALFDYADKIEKED